MIFLWTPPHFWALAMKFRDDYAAASVPMLPVVAAPQVVTRKILGYSYAMVGGHAGPGPVRRLDLRGLRRRARRLVPGRGAPAAQPESPPADPPAPMRLFHLSIAYLTLLFTVIAVTAVLPVGHW